MRIDVLTVFPEMFGPVVTDSILGRANESGLLDVRVHNVRDYTTDKHNKTDEAPFGGGAGMVMFAEPISACLEDIGTEGRKLLYMSPRGKVLTHEKVLELAAGRKDALPPCAAGGILADAVRNGRLLYTGRSGEVRTVALTAPGGETVTLWRSADGDPVYAEIARQETVELKLTIENWQIKERTE